MIEARGENTATNTILSFNTGHLMFSFFCTGWTGLSHYRGKSLVLIMLGLISATLFTTLKGSVQVRDLSDALCRETTWATSGDVFVL